METKKEITLDEIYTKKAELRRQGIAEFHINNMSEDDSIRQLIAEAWSVCFYCVRDPYHGSRGKKSDNIRFRLFQIVKEKPQIPMGYAGSPGFDFECHDGQPAKKAIEIMKKTFKGEYRYIVKRDEITCSPVLNKDERKARKEAEVKEATRYQVQDSDSNHVRGVKLDIAKLEKQSAKMKAINKALKRGTDFALEELGLSKDEIVKVKTPDFVGRVGFPGYRLTSISTKVRRLKTKLN